MINISTVLFQPTLLKVKHLNILIKHLFLQKKIYIKSYILIFLKIYFIVSDDLPPSSEFARVFANDSDIGLNGLVTYELMNHKDKFRIDAFTGSISTKSGIVVNDEENVVYDLSVVASDRGRPALR